MSEMQRTSLYLPKKLVERVEHQRAELSEEMGVQVSLQAMFRRLVEQGLERQAETTAA